MSTLFGKSKRKRAVLRKEGEQEKDSLVDLSSATTEQSLDTEKKSVANKIEDGKGEEKDHSNSSRKRTLDHLNTSPWTRFEDLGLAEPLLAKCKSLGFKKPTPVQRTIIPYLLQEDKAHVLALAKTGSGKTAAFVLPILHRLALDPYGIYAIILTPTRELAKQIHQQVLAFGSAYNVQSALVVGGLDAVRQATELDKRPHFCVATPGRLAELLRGPNPPRLKHLRFLVLDEADRLLASGSGFERDMAELLIHCHGKGGNVQSANRQPCQTLLFSATMTRSLESMEELAGAGKGRLPLEKFVIRDDGELVKKKKRKENKKDKDSGAEGKDSSSDGGNQKNNDGDDVDTDASSDDSEDEVAEALAPKIPEGLKQEYIFMPSRVRDAYLLTAIRKLMVNGGRVKKEEPPHQSRKKKKGRDYRREEKDPFKPLDEDFQKARLAIVFVSTCERAAMVSCILEEVGVDNVALHSLLSQNRRLAALAKFKSEQVRVLVATDVASRGLDIPTVDLVLNSELPRNSTNYVHRVGRTARAGRRGLAISLVGESDVALVHAAERISGRALEKCQVVSDDEAIKMLGPVTKAARLAKMKLMDIGFDDLVKKFKERKIRDRKERERIERALRRQTEAGSKKS